MRNIIEHNKNNNYNNNTKMKHKTKWEKQNNSNKYIDNGCIRSRNTTVERD